MKVADKVAIVTGGGNGIGAALAAKLAHQDARVVVADINSQAADAVASGINADRAGTAIASGGDVSDTDHIKQLIDAEPAAEVLSDDTIVEKLRDAGIDIARRTVAKYREAMRIPSSVERRRMLKEAC